MNRMVARVVVIGALLAAGSARAQWYESYRPKQSIYLFNYEISTTLGSFSDNFINATSWRGFGFEGRSMVREHISAGLGFDFNRYSQTHSLITQPAGNGGTISGPIYRYADQFALKALFHYYLGESQSLRPYAGFGIGGAWTYSFAQTGDIGNSHDSFDFVISPEVGLLLTFAKGASTGGLNVAVRYTYTTADFAKVTDAQSLQVILGLFVAY
jgi:hypothetical protein